MTGVDLLNDGGRSRVLWTDSSYGAEKEFRRPRSTADYDEYGPESWDVSGT